MRNIIKQLASTLEITHVQGSLASVEYFLHFLLYRVLMELPCLISMQTKSAMKFSTKSANAKSLSYDEIALS